MSKVQINEGRNTVFVFGSNLAGVHGAGAAKDALQYWGAILYKGIGRVGDSWALPTKCDKVRYTLPVFAISAYVEELRIDALSNEDEDYLITRIGCGLAGYKDSEIAPLFEDFPINCYFDEEWREFLGDKVKYWGTFDMSNRSYKMNT